MKIRLELAHKKAKVKKVLLKADTIIGRSTECGLRIASTEISRQHCKICITEDSVTVRDLGSSNGTFVNGYQLEPDTDYEIAPDSELALGGIKFVVRFSDAPKVMQSDGMGSTVDLKPGEKETAIQENTQRKKSKKAKAEPEPESEPAVVEEEMHFDETEPESEPPPAPEPEPTPKALPVVEANSDETVTKEVKVPDADDEETITRESLPASPDETPTRETLPEEAILEESVTEEPEFEMSTHGDSAILEREDAQPDAVVDEVKLELDGPDAEVEVDPSEFDFGDINGDDEAGDFELELQEPTPKAAPKVVEQAAVETEVKTEPDDVELEVKEAEPEMEVEEEPEVEEEAEPEMEVEEEPGVEEEAEPEMEVEEEAESIEDPIGVPEPEEPEMSEDDVAAFLNQVDEEEDEESNGDETLGDFFKQFD